MADIGLGSQEAVPKANGFAIQCRNHHREPRGSTSRSVRSLPLLRWLLWLTRPPPCLMRFLPDLTPAAKHWTHPRPRCVLLLKPDAGRIEAYAVPGGPGIRVDGSLGTGNTVNPFYDSMLCKLIAKGPDFISALDEARARPPGVLCPRAPHQHPLPPQRPPPRRVRHRLHRHLVHRAQPAAL